MLPPWTAPIGELAPINTSTFQRKEIGATIIIFL
jgi:hypothetical protein